MVMVPAIQLAAHARNSTFYSWSHGSKSKVFQLDELLLFPIIMGLRCALQNGNEIVNHMKKEIAKNSIHSRAVVFNA